MRMTEGRCRLFGAIIVALFGAMLLLVIINEQADSLGVLGWIKQLLILCLGCLMIRAKKDNVSVIAVLVFCFIDIITSFMGAFSFWTFIGLIAPLLLAVLTFVNWKMSDKSAALNKFWYIVPIAAVVPYLAVLIRYGKYLVVPYVLIVLIGALLYGVLYYAFACWMSFRVVDNGYDQRLNPEAYFKDLLDRGIITQAEYEEKISKLK